MKKALNTKAKKSLNLPGDNMTDHVPDHQRIFDDNLLPNRFAELLFEVLSVPSTPSTIFTLVFAAPVLL